MLDTILARPGETLMHHTEGVIARVATLATLKRLPQYPSLWRRLFWAAVLHDSGKLAPGFQRGLRSKKHRWGLRHEVLSLAFLEWFAFNAEDRIWIAAAIASHHHDFPYIWRYYLPLEGQEEAPGRVLMDELSEDTLRVWCDWLAGVVPIWAKFFSPEIPIIIPHYVPLTAENITDQLMALRAWAFPMFQQGLSHPHTMEATLLRGLLMIADRTAAAEVVAGTALVLSVVLPPHPYTHQRQSAQTSGDGLLVAPTGSGKTEAALLWAARQKRPTLFYLLPYRASLNAMAERLTAFIPSEQIGVQHGRALQSRYLAWLEQGYSSDEAGTRARQQHNLARLRTQPANLFTPYHLLQAVYRRRSSEMLLAHVSEGALIMDEIHAYDPRRLALILGSLGFLQQHLGVRLFIMTATLPPVVRQVVQHTLPGLLPITAERATFQAFQRHRLVVRDGDLMLALDEILAQAKQGQAVLVTVNTVRRARTMTKLLRQSGGTVWLLHSRFNGRDRWQHERRIMQQFRSGTEQPPQPMPIVVSTQVIEVSLDLDFDLLYTDPAPLDALIQRFGRVNRRRQQPQLARVVVFETPTGREERFPVYDVELVDATLAVLRDHHHEPVEETSLAAWLAQVYSGERATRWLSEYAEAEDLFYRAVLALFHPFEEADQGLQHLFRSLLDECLVLPLSLEDEYMAHIEDDPIAASLLLVSLSYRQYKMLERNREAWREEELFIVDRPYSAADGLQITDDTEE